MGDQLVASGLALNREQTYRDLLDRQSLPEQLRRVIAVA
jgi:hypothetical protein